MHWHTGVAIDGMNCHLRLKVCRVRFCEVVALWGLITLHRRHAAEGEGRILGGGQLTAVEVGEWLKFMD